MPLAGAFNQQFTIRAYGTGLITAEWTGSPVLHTLWSYVLERYFNRLLLIT